MNFGTILKKIRQDNNLTQEELAKKINTSRSNIANYENNKNMPSVDVLEKISKVFNCSTDYLMGKSKYRNQDTYIQLNELSLKKMYDNSLTNHEKEIINNIINRIKENNFAKEEVENFIEIEVEKTDSNIKDILKIMIMRYYERYYPFSNYNSKIDVFNNSSENNSFQYYMCPVYGQISAGQPNWAEECIEGRLPLDTDLMGIVNPEEHFFLRVNGESMNKVIRNGAFALIHKQDTVENGEIAVVLVNGYDATLKRFTRQGELIVLEPQSNDNSFETQVYDKTTPIKILGKYVGKMEINK